MRKILISVSEIRYYFSNRQTQKSVKIVDSVLEVKTAN
nr:MAG TPA: hypothetical protein [Caudoviricetes sp.]